MRHLAASGPCGCKESVDCQLLFIHIKAMRTYPAIVVLVKHTDELSGTQLKLVVHGRLELEVNTVHIAGLPCTGRRGSRRTLARSVRLDAQWLGHSSFGKRTDIRQHRVVLFVDDTSSGVVAERISQVLDRVVGHRALSHGREDTCQRTEAETWNPEDAVTNRETRVLRQSWR